MLCKDQGVLQKEFGTVKKFNFYVGKYASTLTLIQNDSLMVQRNYKISCIHNLKQQLESYHNCMSIESKSCPLA